MDANKLATAVINDGKTSFNLKAVYVDNDDCITGANNAAAATARRYTVTFDDFSRFTMAGFDFPVTVKIERKNVVRCVQPALRVQLTVNGVSTYSLYELTGADVEYVTVSLTANANTGQMVGRAVFAVVDQYGTSNWVGAGPRSDNAALTLQGGSSLVDTAQTLGGTATQRYFSEESFGRDGIIGSFNECFENYAADESQNMSSVMGRITAATIRQAGIRITNTPAIAVRRQSLYEAWKKQNTVDGTLTGALKLSSEYTDLTWEQVRDILASANTP